MKHVQTMIEFVSSAKLPTRWGEFTICGFKQSPGGIEHVALALGDMHAEQPLLTRIHSQCLTGDAFHSLRCDCGDQLDRALKEIVACGRGLLIYLNQEGRGIGLLNKIRAYALQDNGDDTVEANEKLGFPADSRDYSVAVSILRSFHVRHVRLLTNNPLKLDALVAAGISVERVPIKGGVTAHNSDYLLTKHRKLGHLQ